MTKRIIHMDPDEIRLAGRWAYKDKISERENGIGTAHHTRVLTTATVTFLACEHMKREFRFAFQWLLFTLTEQVAVAY